MADLRADKFLADLGIAQEAKLKTLLRIKK